MSKQSGQFSETDKEIGIPSKGKVRKSYVVWYRVLRDDNTIMFNWFPFGRYKSREIAENVIFNQLRKYNISPKPSFVWEFEIGVKE